MIDEWRADSYKTKKKGREFPVDITWNIIHRSWPRQRGTCYNIAKK